MASDLLQIVNTSLLSGVLGLENGRQATEKCNPGTSLTNSIGPFQISHFEVQSMKTGFFSTAEQLLDIF